MNKLEELEINTTDLMYNKFSNQTTNSGVGPCDYCTVQVVPYLFPKDYWDRLLPPVTLYMISTAR